MPLIRLAALPPVPHPAVKGGPSDGKLSLDELKNAGFIRELAAAVQ